MIQKRYQHYSIYDIFDMDELREKSKEISNLLASNRGYDWDTEDGSIRGAEVYLIGEDREPYWEDHILDYFGVKMPKEIADKILENHDESLWTYYDDVWDVIDSVSDELADELNSEVDLYPGCHFEFDHDSGDFYLQIIWEESEDYFGPDEFSDADPGL